MSSAIAVVISAFLLFGIINNNFSLAEDEIDYKITVEYKDAEKAKNNFFKIDFKKGLDTISAKAEQFVELKNDDTIECEVFSTGAEQKDKPIFKLSPKGICDIMKSYYKNFFYDSLKDYSNAPAPETCPLPKQKYQLTDYPLKSSKIIKFIKPGTYDIKCILRSTDLSEQYEFQVIVEEKK